MSWGEVLLYSSSFWTSGTFMPPRWKFIEELSDRVPKGTEAVLEFGFGSARLIDMIVRQRSLLARSGVYIAIDCNPKCFRYVQKHRPHLLRDDRVRLIQGFAQCVKHDIEEHLDGRSCQVIISSLPHSWLPEEDSHAIWEGAIEHADDSCTGILYNVRTSIPIMSAHWKDIQTEQTKNVHFGLPPEFEVNYGTVPLRNGNGKINGTPLNDRNSQLTRRS